MAPASSLKHDDQISYENFLHSMTDKPQYFSFFLDKACGIASKIGINKNAYEKEEYAIVAIEHLWGNLDKFDPSKGEFSTFFNAVIGNKIKDQIRSSVSDKVFGCNSSGSEELENHGDSFSDEGADTIRKKREFGDKMVAAFKDFIDALPPEKRLTFCATEFGKWTMGEEQTKRNYSKLVAAQIGKTDDAVRQMAKYLIIQAKEYITNERGFNYDAYSTHMQAFITTKPKESKVDYSTLDWTALSGVQRLKVRMYLYEKAVEDGIISE